MKNIKAFTLTELIIGISISAIVLVAVLSFVANVMSDFWKSKKKTEFITTLYDFTTTVNEYKAVFNNASILSTSWAHDALFLYSTGSTGVIFWVVDPNTWLLDPITQTNVYSSKKVWYKELTVNQVSDRLAWSGSIYDYDFFWDKIFQDMVVKSFTLTEYNVGDLINLDLELIIYYKDDLDGNSLDTLTPEDLFELTLTF